MVLLSYSITLFFLSLTLGIFILLITKKKTHRVFGFLFIILSSIFLVTSYDLTAEIFVFIALGLFIFLLIFSFQMRDLFDLILDESKSEDKKDG
jgi:hypothetical protein